MTDRRHETQVPDTAPAPLLYVLTDTSGSTARTGFAEGCRLALPRLVAALEQLAGPRAKLSVMAYASQARVEVALTSIEHLQLIPHGTPDGLSSLAAGLRALAEQVSADRDQLRVD